MTASSNKKIIRNTIFLYIRMFFILGITLYTSRIILKALGIEDYGIYTVVAGFISLFSFLNYSMSSAVQRFFSFEIGRGDFQQLSKVFNCALLIYIVIAIIVVILTETIGLWFLYNKIVIPIERFSSAVFVFHFSVVVLIIQTIMIPFNALIQARERMDVYAFISLIDIFLKLIAVYILLINFQVDKLKMYSILILIISIINALCYFSYCHFRFKESHFKRQNDKKFYKELLFYSGWSLFGNIAGLVQTQGLNVLLNIFLGPIVNAAYGIMMQVQNAVNLFANSFFSAVKPQIIQSYSSSDMRRFHFLINKSSKYSFILVSLLVFPIIYNIEFILNLWLGNNPQYTKFFIIYSLLYIQIESLSYSLMTAVQATGNIKIYQILIGTLIFLNLPVSYFLLHYGFEIALIFIVLIIISLLSLVMRFFFLQKLVDFNIYGYVKTVLIRVVCLTIMNNVILYYLSSSLPVNFELINNVIKILVFVLITLIISILIGLDKNEKIFIIHYIKNKFTKNSN